METQRKDVKNLLCSRRLLMMFILLNELNKLSTLVITLVDSSTELSIRWSVCVNTAVNCLLNSLPDWSCKHCLPVKRERERERERESFLSTNST